MKPLVAALFILPLLTHPGHTADASTKLDDDGNTLRCSYIEKYLERTSSRPVHYMQCTVFADHVVIQNIVINRGNCDVSPDFFPTMFLKPAPVAYEKQYKFGDMFRFFSSGFDKPTDLFSQVGGAAINECPPIEVEIHTDQGILTLRKRA